MISLNSPNNVKQSHIGILINGHVTVQVAAEVTGYNIQYLRRMLRSGKLRGVKIGQMWLIEMDALEAYLKHVESTSDRRCGPR
jgi:excisionase family DNA binding protein